LIYGALLVFPTLAFGWLYWRALEQDYREQLEAVPVVAQDGARRIVAGMRDRLAQLLESESQRAFTQYAWTYHADEAYGSDLALTSSPIVRVPTPTGILAWFSFDRLAGLDGEVEILVGDNPLGNRDSVEAFRPIVEEFRRHKSESDRQTRIEIADMQPTTLPLTSLAVALGYRHALECVKASARAVADRAVTVSLSGFKLEFYIDAGGRPRAFATRRVYQLNPVDDLPHEARCLAPLLGGFAIQQGFLIDGNWLFQNLPGEISLQVLDPDESLRVPSAVGTYDDVDRLFASIYPVRELGFGTNRPEDETFGRLEVQVNADGIRERFETQSRRFLLVAMMLVLTLATGMTLLYRSVGRELEQAHRMQNFVAAVTHELRTPASTIKLYGENLLEGYVTDPASREQYYREIVRAADRLSLMVERVLEKSRLKENVPEPSAADLNGCLRALEGELAGSTDDLAWDLAPNLPRVWLIPESVRWILTNMVENARKYAPVQPGAERILIRTRYDGKHVLLDVCDRGPGVPPSERERIFDAFYRIGSETTRRTTGTGLGLHLVQLHAEAIGAMVSVQEREGGGSVFRVALRPAF
jgi:signal transduction histidine kinase